VRIAFVYAGGRQARWRDACAGRAPTDFFYGAIELAKAGHDVLCIDAPEPRGSWLAAGYNLLLDWRTPARTRGGNVAAVRRILPQLRDVDAVVAASTSQANALALWKRAGLLRAPLVGIHCGHVNHTQRGARLASTKSVLREQEIVLFADAEREETIRQFDVDGRRIHANSFGVDTDFWTPAEAPREFVLAVGNDGRRDYATLVRAAESLRAPVKILTARELPQPLPANVEHLRGSWHAPALTDAELRELYRCAIAVVVPLEDSIQPSGQSVALQAMACGRPVILTRTRGLWTGADFRDGRDILLVASGSAEELRLALERVIEDPGFREALAIAGRESVMHAGRIDDFAARLGKVLSQFSP
jgi:glycosyltransferase involved in cell wall biosynthesis